MLRPTTTGVFRLAGRPDGIEHLGGIDFDEAVYSAVLRTLGQEAVDLAGSDDEEVLHALAAIRRGCVRAKEQLSSEEVTEVVGELAGRRVCVRVTRQELEAMIRPALGDTVAAFERAVRNAGTTPEALTSVVLVGGSVRIPLVFETVSRRLDCQIVLPREPGHSVALGAAMAAERYRIPTSTTARTRVRRSAEHEPRPPALHPRREATLVVRELFRPGADGEVVLDRWAVADGAPVVLGQPLVQVRLAGGRRTRTLQSPFEGVVHRHFLEQGQPLRADDLLVAFRQVTAFLARPGRSLGDDQGVLLRVPPPTSPSAGSFRPVVLVDRVPRAIWWSAGFCLLASAGRHTVSVAYTGRNQWYGFASAEVVVPEGGLVVLEYRDPGAAATALLQPVVAGELAGAR